jgi:ABC-type multidrug transport system fused ATPase/permease subunit
MRDWLVAAAGVGVCIPLALLVRKLDRPMTESSMKLHERESEITTHVQEALSGIRAVQAFGRETLEDQPGHF